MVKKATPKILGVKGTRIFKKTEPHKETKYFRRSTMTDAEILELREKLGVVINDSKKYSMGSYKKPL